MTKDLYHGSNHIIKKPVYGAGKENNDHGLGFYCTENKDLAKEWAVDSDRDGYSNHYELDCTDLKILDLTQQDFIILNWLAILVQNREFNFQNDIALEAKEYLLENFLPDYESYDVIIGYRTCASNFTFAQDFLNGILSYGQFNQAMQLESSGTQVVLKSKKAFDRLRFIDAERIDHIEWYKRKEQRDLQLRKDYFNMRRNGRKKGELYMVQILDEEMKSNDLRLR